MNAEWQNDPALPVLARTLKQGGVIAYPTEAVWGLGCDPHNEGAVHRLLGLKTRPVEKGLILVASSIHQLAGLTASLSEQQMTQLSASWPGPHTWLIPATPDIPLWIRGQHSSVAVRVSAHPLVQALCESFGGPLVSTSANPQGLPEARSAAEVQHYFGDELDGLAPGEVGDSSSPSSIRDLITGETIR